MRVNILLPIVKEDLRRNVRHQMGRSVGDVNIVFMYEILNTIKKKSESIYLGLSMPFPEDYSSDTLRGWEE